MEDITHKQVLMEQQILEVEEVVQDQHGNHPTGGGDGGSGIVIIRYKYQ
jgi:hypothetical protein